MTITITGTARLLSGALLPLKTMILYRNPGAVFGVGADFWVPEPVTVISDGSALVSFDIEPGIYVGEVATATGPARFPFLVDDAPSTQTFSECLNRVTSQVYNALQLSLLAASGLKFYATRLEVQTDTTKPLGYYFLSPNGASGLAVWEKFTSISIGTSTRFIAAVFATVPFAAGTLADPGLSVDGDTDTGFHSPGANRLAAGAGGVLGWEINTTTMQINRPVTGTAITQTAVDATAGRLTKVGDFGLGSEVTPLLAAADAIDTPAGQYGTNNATTGVLPAGENVFGQMIVMRFNAGNFSQIWMSSLSDTLYTRRYRTTDAPAWSPWRPLFSRHNLLGTVSQTAGVPTGAVIQRGSTANGEFVRFADGTLICTSPALSAANVSTADGALFRSGDVAWTFPSAFVAGSVPAVSPCHAADVDCWPTLQLPTATAVNARLRSTVTKAGAVLFRLQATGRWF